ncbi:MAG: T9SS type A sorting domain-containing protein, partial [Bacteroidota bacterium]
DGSVTEVPINLTITGQPELYLVSEQLVFGEVYRTFSRTQKLAVHNRGTDTLTINSVVSDNRIFAIKTEPIAIAPQEKYRFEVTFSPESLGEQFGEVIIASDDPQQPETIALLQGIGLEPPLLLISQPEVVSEVVQDSTLTRQVRLQNTSFTQTLSWALSGELPEWLIPLDSSGNLSPRTSSNFRFELSAENQEVGQYEAQVQLQVSEDSLAILPVTMVVIEPNLPPVWSDSLVNLSVAINNAEAQVDLRSLITDPENDSLQFSFRWTGETRATAKVLGNDLSIVPQREGTSQGIISAKDQAGNQVEVSLVLTVLPENQSPQPVQDTLVVAIRLSDKPIELNLDSLFTDPDQDSLIYSFSRPSFSSIDLDILESSVANLRIQDHLLIGQANALGEKETLVYAYDPAGDYSSLTLIISVLEPNQPPLLVQELENQVLVEDQRQIISLLPLFDDPEKDSLQFQVEIEDPTVASIELGADSLQIIALAPGETNVRILAQDEADNQVSVSFSLKVDQVTAVSSLLLEEKFSIYPNPTTNWVTVEHPQLQAIRIYDAQGKLYREVANQLADKVQLSVADLPNGIYSLMVLTQQGKAYRKQFIKK